MAEIKKAWIYTSTPPHAYMADKETSYNLYCVLLSKGHS